MSCIDPKIGAAEWRHRAGKRLASAGHRSVQNAHGGHSRVAYSGTGARFVKSAMRQWLLPLCRHRRRVYNCRRLGWEMAARLRHLRMGD